jgi:hypothetical protein
MFLTGEGALWGAALTALVFGVIGARALIRLGARKPRTGPERPVFPGPGGGRRVKVPAGSGHRV